MYAWQSSSSASRQAQDEWEYAAIAHSEEYSVHSASLHRGEAYEFQSVASSDEESFASSSSCSLVDDDESESDSEASELRPSSRPQQPAQRQHTSSAFPLLNRALSFFYKKRVTFDRFGSQVYEIPNTEHLTHAEFEAMYYKRDELKRLKKERNRIVDLMDKGILNAEDDDMCCGLETYEDSFLRAKISEESVRGVCDEQARSWEAEKEDDDASQAISEVYFDSSFASHLEAHERALQLERSIQGYACPSRWSSRRTEVPPTLPRLCLGHASAVSYGDDDDDSSVTSFGIEAALSTPTPQQQQQEEEEDDEEQQQRQEAPKLPIRRYSSNPSTNPSRRTTRAAVEKKTLSSLGDPLSSMDATLPPKLPIRRYSSTNSIDVRLSIRI